MQAAVLSLRLFSSQVHRATDGQKSVLGFVAYHLTSLCLFKSPLQNAPADRDRLLEDCCSFSPLLHVRACRM
jgi:hypothetical protein